MIHYLSSIEKTIDIFGYLFSNIKIRRWNTAKTDKQDILIPIEFNSKERMFYLLNTKVKENNIKIDSVFPRMTYSIKNIEYDNIRMLNRDIFLTQLQQNGRAEIEQNRIPYNIPFTLSIAATHKSDLFMILEQILPWFAPDLNLICNLNPYIGDDKVSVPILLQNGTFSDNNQDTPFSNTESKLYFYDMEFLVKTWLYCTNNEGNDGSYPDSSSIGKTIENIKLGTIDWNNSKPVTDDSLYPIIYPNT